MSKLLQLSAMLAAGVLAAATAAEAAKPAAVVPSVPDGAVTGPSPALTWNRLGNADSYQLQGYDKKGNKVLSMTVTATEANCTNRPFCRVLPAMPFPPGPNKWRVRAKNEDGTGPWSAYAGFWVGGPVVYESAIVASHPIVAGAQTVTSIEVDLPGPGGANVTSTGLLSCARANADGSLDISTVVTDDPADSATGVRPGIITLWGSIGQNERISMPQATGRVFPVTEGGPRTFYWRSNGVGFNAANDSCTIYAAVLTVQYFPWQGEAIPPPPPGASAGGAPAGTTLGR